MEKFNCNTNWSNVPKFIHYALLLNEDQTDYIKPLNLENQENFQEKLLEVEQGNEECQITRLANLFAEKILTHSGEEVLMIGPEEVLQNSAKKLTPVMYRTLIEEYITSSLATFKIIQCHNITKLSTNWKPSLPDFLISLGYQVIIVEVKEKYAAYYNDFSYAVLRQINHDWKERLPRSFFHPHDACTLTTMPDRHLMILTPSLPDGELEFSNVKNKLQLDILTMLKNSCLSSMQNHLLFRDLRIGKLGDAMDGFECIRQVYRELQRRIKSGEEVMLGSASEDLKLYMATKAGLSLSSAESLLTSCKILDIERDIESTTDNWDVEEDDDNQPIIEIKQPIPIHKWDELQLISRQPSQTNLPMDQKTDSFHYEPFS